MKLPILPKNIPIGAVGIMRSAVFRKERPLRLMAHQPRANVPRAPP